MYAISSLLLVVTLSLLVGRVATAVLVATGLDARVARFQARSALTGAGFTTSESEQITSHPLRRRIVMQLMLVGNAGLVASASSLILGFRGGRGGAPSWERILELVVGLLVLVYLSRARWVDRRLTGAIAHVLRRYTDVETRDLGGLLQLAGDYEVAELLVEDGDWVAGRRLADLELREEGVVVLGVDRAGGAFRGAPVGATVVHPGDTLVVYGRHADLAALDRRGTGADGDAEHEHAARRRLREVQAEQASDAAA